MSDLDPGALPPAPPEPLIADAPASAAAPWQERLEVVALLLLLSAAATLVARFANAYDLASSARPFTNQSADLVSVVRMAGQQSGPIAAGSILLAFLLVTLGPGDRISQRGVVALRAATVVGLAVAGVCAFAAIATLIDSADAGGVLGDASSSPRDALNRVSMAVPLLVAAAIAGYVAWCAFATLGEVPPEPVIPGPEPAVS
ncbi:MAG TPA: hypothetical protein VNS19_00190 [Acidimicrobiales bacterium]|jgi:hypothetical protein|nr:hypothetical protein [Acidimicrobiales bacterium]